MSAGLFVLTSARETARPYEYLEATVAGIDAEDLDVDKTIVCDGLYTGDYFDGWEIIQLERPANEIKGNKRAYWKLLEHAVRRGGDVVALEDDLVFCRNSVRRMISFPVPGDLAWVQFFSPHVLRHNDCWPGLWRPPAHSALFLQAAKFSSVGARRVLAWRDDPEFLKFVESDRSLNLAATRLGLRYGVHAPDLVDHVGDTSLAGGDSKLDGVVAMGGTGTTRRSYMFSRALDALSLYSRDDLYR